MTPPSAHVASSGAVFGLLVAVAGVFAAFGLGIVALPALAVAGFAGGMMVRTPGTPGSFAQDVGGVVLVGAFVAAATGGAFSAHDEAPAGLPAAVLACFLPAAALVPLAAALRDAERPRPARAPEPAMVATLVVVGGATIALVGMETGVPVVFSTAMAMATLLLAGRIHRLAPALAATALQSVVALLVSLVAGKLGDHRFAESAWRLALVLPVLAPMVASMPPRRGGRSGWVETGAVVCCALALTTTFALSVIPRTPGLPILPVPAVAAIVLPFSLGVAALSRFYPR